MLAEIVRVLMWVAGIGLAIVAYELLRASVLRGARIRLEHSVSEYLARHKVRLDRFKFTHKHYIREALLNDPDLGGWIADFAQESGEGTEALRLRAESYIEEIVPFFSLVSYYKLGFGIARPVLRLLYDVVREHENLHAAAEACAEEDAVVFVMNHRSNADYIVFAYVMSREVALSYAVGEWARVWPLETLFKSFGSYFVRRGERDPLYHQVLSKYLQLVTRGGLTQGIFLEGGLSRDGRLRAPKVGLLDSLLRVVAEPSFHGDVKFVPIGLNFDRVLEDVNLLGEKTAKGEAPGALDKFRSLGFLMKTLPRLALHRLRRVLKGAWTLAKKRRWTFGVAAVHAGSTIGMRDFFGDDLVKIAALPRKERRVHLIRFAEVLMKGIAAEIPVTSVPLFVTALEDTGAIESTRPVARAAVLKAIRTRLEQARAAGAAVMLGPEFEELAGERAVLDSGRRGGGLLDFERDLIGDDEADGIYELATTILAHRRALLLTDDQIEVLPGSEELLRYYARSVEQHFEDPPTT
jgi:glycerol-3-phosphate O-acyltransferase